MSEATSPEQPLRQFEPPRSRPSAEEDRAWSQLYVAIGQSSAATEVVEQLDRDFQAKHSHLALYIRAKTTLREQQVAQERNRRIGAFLRQALVFALGPVRLLRSALSTSAGVAVEMLPPARREPAKVRARALKSDPAFASAKDRFASSANPGAQTPAEAAEPSRGAKAA